MSRMRARELALHLRQVIGKNEVAVPTHLFKVVVAERYGQTVLAAFIVPNEPIAGHVCELAPYQVLIASLCPDGASTRSFAPLAARFGESGAHAMPDVC